MAAVPTSSSSSISASTSTYPFEGCEKRLVIRFKPYNTGSRLDLHRAASEAGDRDLKDLRNITTSTWSTILQHAQCSILSTIMNEECIAHLLSESSLFVYRDHLMIKTCGTTSVLHIVSALYSHCELLRLAIDCVFYSRSSFMFPAAQPELYQDFNKEVRFLDRTLEALYTWDKAVVDGDDGTHDGHATFGADGESQWHCYTRQLMPISMPSHRNEQTLELVMFDLEPASLDLFFAHHRATQKLGKPQVDVYARESCSIPVDACVDSFLFEPCGYSLNAILADKYWSIHITPEDQSSFISFETNFEFGDGDGSEEMMMMNVIDRMLRTFRPKRFGFAMNVSGKCRRRCSPNNSNASKELCFKFKEYSMTNDAACHLFSESHSVRWVNYVKDNCQEPPKSYGIPMLMVVFSVLLALVFAV